MLIEFSANASELHRACVRLAARLADTADEEHQIQFKVTSGKLGIAVGAESANLVADVRSTGTALVPFTVLAGVAHMLPYFGDKTVGIGLSNGKMRVDTTVFHTRSILLSSSDSMGRRRPLLPRKTLQTA